ncbi:hypothetical protein J6590_039911 [Homalodisca vitripennis]|nr:hypothetical protein J6590_039911 [Homalodisca vitripennis]
MGYFISTPVAYYINERANERARIQQLRRSASRWLRWLPASLLQVLLLGNLPQSVTSSYI